MNFKTNVLILLIAVTAIATSETRSTLFSTGTPETTEGYLIYAGESEGFSLSDRFTVNSTYTLSSFGVFLGMQSDQATALVQIRYDDANSPGEIIHEETIQLDPLNSLGQLYTVSLINDCITLAPDNYWLTVLTTDTSSQIIWLHAPTSSFPISSSTDNGITWTSVTYGTPGSALVAGDILFFPENLFPGDMNGDFLVDVTDIVTVVGLILQGEELTPEQLLQADITGDGNLDVLDIVRMVDVILTGLNNPVIDFALEDINDNSPTFGEMVGPFLYEGQVSAFYFGKAG
ncbi:MAG: hypothetical protein HQ510_00205 [Candidatus Marinimicrobia bacterium]|nr:hypothetical protein [Candidatus Neomarinimicrobiota bacterium]